MPAHRGVLDTNVLLSGIAYPASLPGKLLAAWRDGSMDVVLSFFILDELRRVLPKLAHRHQLSSLEIDDLVDSLAILAEVVEPRVLHDPALTDCNDQPVLGTLLAALAVSSATCLITGDKALLALRDRYPISRPPSSGRSRAVYRPAWPIPGTL